MQRSKKITAVLAGSGLLGATVLTSLALTGASAEDEEVGVNLAEAHSLSAEPASAIDELEFHSVELALEQGLDLDSTRFLGETSHAAYYSVVKDEDSLCIAAEVFEDDSIGVSCSPGERFVENGVGIRIDFVDEDNSFEAYLIPDDATPAIAGLGMDTVSPILVESSGADELSNGEAKSLKLDGGETFELKTIPEPKR